MNIMNRVTWRAMWRNKVRTLVTIAGIILSAAMFAAVTTLGVSLVDYLIRAQVYNSGDYFVQFDYSTDDQLAALRQEGSAAKIGDLKTLGYTTFQLTSENGHTSDETCIVAAGDENFFDMVTIHLEEGRLPEKEGEIVITRNIYWYLKEAGLPCEVGEIVTLDVVPEYIDEYLELPSAGGRAFTKSYMIVGISEYFVTLSDQSLDLSHLFTYAQPEDTALWHRLFVKTSPATAAHDIHGREYGMASTTNSQLLNLYGASKYVNYNHFIYAICAALMVIILVGSVSLIYNAFSISVSERTKQFGLLTSVGATKKQLRRSVYFEALALSAIGVPIGLFCGYAGIAVTLHLTRDLISGLLAGTVEGGIELGAVASAPAFLCAGVVSTLTVLLSAWIPARRATKVSPIAAIRQAQDYRLPKKEVKSGPLSTRLWGLPGLMAKKYYAVSKRKYRSTIISLTISVALFLTSVGFTQLLQNTAEANDNTYNYDFELYSMTPEQIPAVRSHQAVEDSVLCAQYQWMGVLEEDAFTQDYVDAFEEFCDYITWENQPLTLKNVNIAFLEDEAFREYLAEHGIDEAPYFDAESPAALVCGAKIPIYEQTDGEFRKRVLMPRIFRDGVEDITLYSHSIPNDLHDYIWGISDGYYWDMSLYDGLPMQIFHFADVDEDAIASTPYLQPDGSLYVVQRPAVDENGSDVMEYYLYDPVSDALAESPVGITQNPTTPPKLRLGEQIDELPFGVSTDSGAESITLVMPLSMSTVGEEFTNLLVRVADYDALTAYLNEQEINYLDHLATQMQYRNIITMVNVFSYGFITLISLICVCNVFNTISTNIALRRRDFGMLRSVGMQNRELNRMLLFECLSYGLRALAVGLPIGLLGNLGIHAIGNSLGENPFHFPIGAVVIAAGSIFLVVLISTLYASSKQRRDNPIEAIRMENL